LVFEEMVLLLLWTADKLSRPTLANLTQSYEGWAWQHGLNRLLDRTEARGLVRREGRAEQLVYRLTELGRLQALGGRDVVARWNRSWDGRWRQVLFDLPAHQKKVRLQLWRWLRTNGFGYLQNSVWIHPDPVGELGAALREWRDDVEAFVLMEAACCPGYTNSAIVAGAWDFAEINKRFHAYIQTVTLTARDTARLQATPAAAPGWLTRERHAWQHALALDPLLPRALWPAAYAGERAWSAKLRFYRQLATVLQVGT
jgi:phenylacetic acid degradation operon negative regulatory protein